LSDNGFEELLKLIKHLLPEGNTLPGTTYNARKVVCPLDWKHRRYMHVLMTASSIMVMEPVVMPLVVVVMVGLVEYALVLPPNLVVVVVLARYDLEQPKVLDQPVRRLRHRMVSPR